jgi:metallo-beta-lactamase family protein
VSLQLQFLGAAGTVTGSRYLVDTGTFRLLVDCGLFQGYKPLRLRNWAPFPVDPRTIGAVVLTHAHLDHSGYLPLLVKNRFRGPIFCTPATRDLAGIMLRDSGHLQEREAEYANRHDYSKHRPALPLYTQEDAEHALRYFVPVEFGREHPIDKDLNVTFRRGGHILGAAMASLRAGDLSILFSGDLGRPASATMLPPEHVSATDYLILESTYGNRKHPTVDAQTGLAEVVTRTIERGGSVLMPTFAVGRAQEVLHLIALLKKANRIPRSLPVFLDSPMAEDATRIFCEHSQDHRLTRDECRAAFGAVRYVRDVAESKALDRDRKPKIILAASGMATGGRVLYHLESLAPDGRNTILFAGFQAGGTRGASMVGGADTVKIHGEQVAIRAEVRSLEMLSAHADADEIVAWLRQFERAPRMTFITHGEPAAAEALRVRLRDELRWPGTTPEHLERLTLIK